MKRGPGDFRRGDRDEIEALLASRGDQLRRARITKLRDEALNVLITADGQPHAEMEGRRARVKTLNEILAIEQAILKDYQETKDALEWGDED